MELLYKYLNGNVEVSLFDDGTKIQEWGDNEGANPIFPNSMDVKITNYCDLNCKFCHEMSTTKGEHGNIDFLLSILKDLPAGTELAIGGGNPLDHPDLLKFLGKCKEMRLVCNMTVNYKHIIPFIKTINQLLDDKMIFGLGISINDSSNLDVVKLIHNRSNIVYHVIAGVNNISILDKIKDSEVNKVLILGYKEVGRGIDYYSEDVKFAKNEWFSKLPHYIGKIHLSFDNLAIDQLNIRRFFNEESWKDFYMGTDGQFTMYIDAVKQEYAVSSTSKERFPIKGTISEIFSNVRSVKGF